MLQLLKEKRIPEEFQSRITEIFKTTASSAGVNVEGMNLIALKVFKCRLW
jgi:hypothetical protein